jgi:hypothetical protein
MRTDTVSPVVVPPTTEQCGAAIASLPTVRAGLLVGALLVCPCPPPLPTCTPEQTFDNPDARRNFLALCEIMFDCQTPVQEFLATHLTAYINLVRTEVEVLPPGNAVLGVAVYEVEPRDVARMYVAQNIVKHVPEHVRAWDWSIFLPVIASVPYLQQEGVMRLGYLSPGTGVNDVVGRVREARNTDFGHLGRCMTRAHFQQALQKVQQLLLLCGAPEDSREVMRCLALSTPRPDDEEATLKKLRGLDTVNEFQVHCVIGYGNFGIVFLVRSPSCALLALAGSVLPDSQWCIWQLGPRSVLCRCPWMAMPLLSSCCTTQMMMR